MISEINYNNYSTQQYGGGGCIDGNCQVEMDDGTKKLVKNIQIGDRVRVNGVSKVGIIRCSVLTHSKQIVTLPNGLCITHKHPIWSDTDSTWIFPMNHLDQKTIELNVRGDMYSFLLEPNEDSCAMMINGYWTVYLAHNNKHKLLQHEFYGTQNVRNAIERLDPNRIGRIENIKVIRNSSGSVCDYEI